MFSKKKLKDKSPTEIKQMLDEAFLNIYVDEDKLFNPLQWPAEFEEVPHLYISHVLSRPEYFYFLCKHVLNVEILPFQAVILKEMWNRRFPMLIGSRGMSKSFSLALYSLLRALLLPKRKILIAGAAFRQSKVIFNYCETIYNNSPLLRDICLAHSNTAGPHHNPDMFYFDIGQSKITAVPVGPGGDKIRGQRAHDLLSDEFNSIPKEVFETVMVGFTAVSSDPIKNVKEFANKKMKEKLKKMMKELGIQLELPEEDESSKYITPNQLIISGTAGYTFEQFYEYWQDWHDIISSKGDPKKLERYIAKKRQTTDMSFDDIVNNINYRDYSIIRIPFEMIPDGFMDKAQVTRSKATMHLSTYLCEYAAVFPDDSQGFFKRSIINRTTCGPNKEIKHDGYSDINFSAVLKGSQQYDYVMGIDPASENDNFAIVILEMHKNHRRTVYTWTTNKKQQKEEIKAGFTKENDYYAYCVLKIRELMRRFKIYRIALDPEGGGRAIREGLMNERLIGPGEFPVFEVVDPNKPKDTDMLNGLHIIEMAKFSTATWLAEANHGLRADLEQQTLIFPYFDTVALAIAEGNDLLNERIYDTLEYNMEEIEELKNELTSITLTRTASNRDRWDTPDMQLPGGKKGKQRKDRYSALLIANMVARQIMNDITFIPDMPTGGFAGYMGNQQNGVFYTGNQVLGNKLAQIYDYLG